MNGVITSKSLLESFHGHNVSYENKFIPIWWTETSAGIDEETAKEFDSKVLKVLCWLEAVTSWIFCDVFKHHKRLKSLRAKRAKLLFLIIKYANFWHSCRRCCRGCFSSLILRSLRKQDVDGNDVWKCNFAFPQSFQSHYMFSKCVLTILELNWSQRFRGKENNWTFVIICSRRSHNCKTGHFTSWKERERLRNVKKWKVHVQSVQN